MLKRDILKKVRGRTSKDVGKASQNDLFIASLPEHYKTNGMKITTRNDISAIVESKPFENCNIALLVRVYVDIKENVKINSELLKIRTPSFIKKEDDNLREGFRCTYLSYHNWISELLPEEDDEEDEE